MPGSYIQYNADGSVASPVKPLGVNTSETVQPVNSIQSVAYNLASGSRNVNLPGWINDWVQNNVANQIAEQIGASGNPANPRSSVPVSTPSVPQVTMPPNVNSATPGTVQAPGSNIGVPTWNQAGTKGNLSQDMWDSYTRAVTANQGAVMKPPTTGWM